MTQAEADKIAMIISTADGGCPHCVRDLCDAANGQSLGYVFSMTGAERFVPWPWSDDQTLGDRFPEVVASPSAK
jgi:hypothetical protein